MRASQRADGGVTSTGLDLQRTWLDHVSFNVASHPDLERAATALTGPGIVHGQITDLTVAGIAIL